jgi:hypothetical protein
MIVLLAEWLVLAEQHQSRVRQFQRDRDVLIGALLIAVAPYRAAWQVVVDRQRGIEDVRGNLVQTELKARAKNAPPSSGTGVTGRTPRV